VASVCYALTLQRAVLVSMFQAAVAAVLESVRTALTGPRKDITTNLHAVELILEYYGHVL